MPMKFNKEMIIKHRFWVMLGTAMTLTLVGIVSLEFVSAEDAINKVKAGFGSAKTYKGPFPNQPVIDAFSKELDKASKSEADVWSKAYMAQEKEFVWPSEVENRFHFINGFFATNIVLTPAKGADPKTWPKDTPTLLHGTVVNQDEQSFVLKTRDGDKTIFATPGVNTILFSDDKAKKVVFADLQKNSADRFAAVTYQRGRYFGDMLTDLERGVFSAPDSYMSQIRSILQLVHPLDVKGEGVVQLKNWLYKPDTLPHEEPNLDQHFLNYVKEEWNRGADFSKGAWIAQEDLWIQKDIYRIIGETNDTVSRFKSIGGGGAEVNKAYVFKNPYFELQLVLQKDASISFTVKNLLNRRQRLDQSFLVKTSDQAGFKPEEIKISADPLMPKGDAGKKDSITKIIPAPKDGTTRKGIYDVHQILTWETAAVKRIDQISIGSNAGGDVSHSHRTVLEGLRPFLKADEDAPDDLGVGGGGAVAPGGPKNPGPGFKGGMPGKFPVKGGGIPGRQFGGKMGAAGVNMQKIPHGLWLTRYVDVSDQSRRIPVAISLIIDQDHVDRVLTHFNNSKLRFLETQVILNQYTGSLQPPSAARRQGQSGPGTPARLLRPWRETWPRRAAHGSWRRRR